MYVILYIKLFKYLLMLMNPQYLSTLLSPSLAVNDYKLVAYAIIHFIQTFIHLSYLHLYIYIIHLFIL